jgi:hypothetical protein
MKLYNKCLCCDSNNTSKTPAVLMPFIAKRIFDYDYVSIDESWNLYNFPAGNAMTICKSVFCNDCNFLFCDMRFDDEEMSKLYHNYRQKDYTNTRDFYEPGYFEKNEIINQGIKYKKDIEDFLFGLADYQNILDWGGDDGINTPTLNAKNLYIYDISEKEVLENFKSLKYEELSEYNYDLIVCSNVLEHVSYPETLLKDMMSAMSDETILYIEVPYEKIMSNSDLINKNEYKRHWHEHINFYSENSLNKLLAKCGLKIIKTNIATDVLEKNITNFSNVFMVACKKS